MRQRGPKGQGTKLVGLHLRLDVIEKLNAECERQGKVPARVVEQAIEAMLAFTENTDA